ncbi:MAG: cytochrome c oxidase subunit II [Proteobacteria bacterium]|nr:MAG: cytochrome c oxidase subunit II [Pseudomonadota bacterium]
MFNFLPEQASEYAPDVDWVHHLITDLSVFFTVAIVGTMIYYAIRYRRRGGVDHETPQITGSHTLEIIWTVVPTIVSIFLAYYGIEVYRKMREIPKDAVTINVWGRKWKWDFEYETGKKTTSELIVPVNKSVKLVMQSRDVLHSLFIPAMRTKKDVIPGQYTYQVFKPVKTGDYPVFCTEYCGTEHWNMLANLRVVSEAEYDRWVHDLTVEGGTPAERGKILYTEKGCNACHSLDGSAVIGPSFLKLWGKQEELADGSKALVDENYIKESILNPNAKLVKGYPAAMPAFDGQLSDDEINAFIAFIKTVDGSQPVVKIAAPVKKDDPAEWAKLSPVQRGEKWIKEKAAPACVTCHSLDGSKLVGPSFKGLYNREAALEGGTKAVANDEYIKNSILNPMAQISQGYPPSMPPAYQTQLKDEDIKDIIEYFKTLK